jgi:hypothetical protein
VVRVKERKVQRKTTEKRIRIETPLARSLGHNFNSSFLISKTPESKTGKDPATLNTKILLFE